LVIRQNVPITVISKRLGHSSPTMTLRIYSHAYNNDMQNVGNMLENLR
jgi:integrase